MINNLSKDELLTGAGLVCLGALLGGSIIKVIASKHDKKIEDINNELLAFYTKLLNNSRRREECYLEIIDARRPRGRVRYD